MKGFFSFFEHWQFHTSLRVQIPCGGRLIRIIAPPVPLFSATRTVGSPLYSIRGREEVSLCPCRLIAPCLPHRNDEMRLSLGLCHLRAASSAAPPHGICTRKLVWNCQCSKKEKNPFTNNQVLGGKDYLFNSARNAWIGASSQKVLRKFHLRLNLCPLKPDY